MTSLGVEIAAQLPEFRRIAESMMQDQCEVTRQTGEPVFNRETGKYDKLPPPEVVYSGACRLRQSSQSSGSSVDSTEAGGRTWTVQPTQLHLPVDGTAGVSVSDVVTVTASRFDASLVGRQYTVQSRHEESHATSRRLLLREATG